MSYSLGVDLGTTFVAVAISHVAHIEMFTLGDRSVLAPAVVYLRDDGDLVTGDAASRRAVSSPERLGGGLKRRLGDATPVMLGGTPHAVTDLLGTLLRDVVQKVAEREGESPERVVLTHPATWGPFRRGLFEELPQRAGLRNALTITESEAAATHYATSRRLNAGAVVAIYDLGGGTFEASVVRTRAEGVEILGTPEGIERLGGIDFDEAILKYVDYHVDGALSELDLREPRHAARLSQLRQDCILAKETLSVDTETILPVSLPDRHLNVRMTRSDFEDMVRAHVESTVRALSRTLRSAKVAPDELNAVLLVGGSSRIPLVARAVSEELGRPIAADTHPRFTVALGAATLAGFFPAGRARGRQVGRHAATQSISVAPSGVAGTSVAAPVPVPKPYWTEDAPPDAARSVTSPDIPRSNGRPPPGADPLGTNDHAETPRREPTPPPWERSPASGGSDGLSARTWILAVAAAVVVLAVALVAVLRLGDSAANPEAVEAAEAPPAPPPVVTASPVEPSASVPNPTVAGVIKVAAGPQSGAIAPDGKLAYVTSTNTHSITLIDLATNGVVGSIPIAAGPPQFVAFTPDGRFAYVSVFDEIRKTGNTVVVVDTATRAVTASIPAEKFPYAIAVSPDGRQLYIPNHDVNLVSVVDTATNAVVQKIAVKPHPHCVAYSVTGRRAYIANHASNVVTVLDTKNGAILAEIPVARSPHAVAMSPDRARVYVVSYDANMVSVIDPATNKVTATIPVQQEPQSVAFAPDSRHAYVVNDGSNTVSVIDTATNRVTANVQVGQDPTHVFVTADGKHAYVTNISSNDVSVLNTAG